MALLAFCSGIASFILVERKESFSQIIALLLLTSWLWLIIDNWLRDQVEQRFGIVLSPNFMRFALQMVQQEVYSSHCLFSWLPQHGIIHRPRLPA